MSPVHLHPRTLLSLGLVALLGAARAEDWPQQGGGPDRGGLARERAGPGTTPCWSVDLGERLLCSPVVADGLVIVVAEAGTVRALDEATGALRWARTLDPIAAAPACGRGRVVLASGQGRVTCLALESGAVLWDRPGAGGGPRAAVGLDGTTVLLSLGFPVHTVQALDLLTGAVRWSEQGSAIGYSPPAVGGGLAIFGANDGRYAARDLATGALLWSYPTGGKVLLSSALIAGQAAFLLPGGDEGRLFAVPLDPARWAAEAWSVALDDPAPPPSWAVLGLRVATCSPAWSGDRVVGVVRFEWMLDLAEPWFTADTWTLHERAFTVDPATRAVTWSAALGQEDQPGAWARPPFGHCPAPVTLVDQAGGRHVARAHSLAARLDWHSPDGAPQGSLALGASERWAGAASPALANARLVLCTAAGRVVALSLGGNSAPTAPVIGTPPGTTWTGPGSLGWQPAADAEDAPGTVAYVVRFDDDGEVLLDADAEVTTAPGSTSLPLPPGLASDRLYTVRVRARDPQGALSPWSQASSVQLSLAPEPPRALVVTPRSATSARLEWLASPSDFVAGYRLRQRSGPAWSAPRELGLVTSCELDGLSAGVSNEVELRAVSRLGRESAPVQLSFVPVPPITLEGGGPGGGWYSLREALAAARAGQVLLLGAGTFRDAGPLHLPRGVILRGLSAHRTRLGGTGRGVVLRILAAGASEGGAPARLERLTVSSAEQGVVLDPGAELVLENALLHDLQDGLVLGQGARATARHLTVVGNRGRGVSVGPAATLELNGALITANALGLDAAGQVTSSWSAIVGNDRDRQGHAPSSTDLAALQPRFLDAAAGDYREAADSPTIDAGDPALPVGEEPAPHGGRVNLGAFGGTAEAASTPAAPPPGGSSSGGSGCALGRPARGPGPALAALGTLALLGLGLRRRLRGA